MPSVLETITGVTQPRALHTALALALALGALVGCVDASDRGRPPPTWPMSGGDLGVASAIGFAQDQVGKRYCWGGTGPDCFDCSGLVQAAWQHGGVKLPRTAGAQGRALVEVPLEHARPGDILWWPSHVGLYVGNGEMIDAYHSRAGVVRRPAARPLRVLRVALPSSG